MVVDFNKVDPYDIKTWLTILSIAYDRVFEYVNYCINSEDLSLYLEDQLKAIGERLSVVRQKLMRLEELKNMPYEEYLNTPEWKEKREMVLELRGRRCEECGSTKDLHVHHWVYCRGEESLEDLVVLCSNCHKKLHEGKELEVKKERERLDYLVGLILAAEAKGDEDRIYTLYDEMAKAIRQARKRKEGLC